MTTRRMLLKGTIATLGGMAAARAIGAEHRPNDVGRKFAADGRVVPFRGTRLFAICRSKVKARNPSMPCLMSIVSYPVKAGHERSPRCLPPVII